MNEVKLNQMKRVTILALASRSEPSKGKSYEDLTEVERKAAAGKKSQNVAPSKQVDNAAPFQLGPPTYY